MYGTPRIAKDTKLYNAIRGTTAQARVHTIMERVLKEHVTLDIKAGGARSI
jgi:hypothetical protein